MTKKTALITGASSGIGLATATEFAKHGINLIICGRNKEKLKDLKEELKSSVDVHILTFDVRTKKDVFSAIESLPENFDQIDILINNAGNAYGMDTIQDGETDDWDAMLDINVKGLLYVSKAIIPQMIERNSGHIINIGSTAGKEVYPKGIRVGAVNPGMVETSFSEVRFKGDKDKAANVYKGFTPLVAEDIADILYFVVSRPAHVNIADLVVMRTDQASSTVVNKS